MVHIEKSKCQAYGNCADEAPGIFRLDDSGYAELVGTEVVPEGAQAVARAAVLSCPARALVATD